MLSNIRTTYNTWISKKPAPKGSQLESVARCLSLPLPSTSCVALLLLLLVFTFNGYIFSLHGTIWYLVVLSLSTVIYCRRCCIHINSSGCYLSL